jgi:hypothetical protein
LQQKEKREFVVRIVVHPESDSSKDQDIIINPKSFPK